MWYVLYPDLGGRNAIWLLTMRSNREIVNHAALGEESMDARVSCSL